MVLHENVWLVELVKNDSLWWSTKHYLVKSGLFSINQQTQTTKSNRLIKTEM